MITFNKVPYIPESQKYVVNVIKSGYVAGDGKYTKLCSSWMENRFCAKKVLLTTSCTAALEMVALLLNIQTGDEVIMPSYTFVSTANAFAMYGAKIIFVDIRPDTMNIDEKMIESAITNKTKAIVVVHYAGVGCEMNTIKKIANKYKLPIIEDAAQGVMSSYQGQALGTIGDLGCYSFHETKNYVMGEGGALVINNEQYLERAEIIREKGTNRTSFFRGEIDKYSWIDIGSSFLPSEINVAYLYGQLEYADNINNNRLESYNFYYDNLKELEVKNNFELPNVPKECKHNAHMFYIKLKNLEQRGKFINWMKQKGIYCIFHYVPLHGSKGGLKYGFFNGIDNYTTKESERLVRLPMYYGLSLEDKIIIIKAIREFIMKGEV